MSGTNFYFNRASNTIKEDRSFNCREHLDDIGDSTMNEKINMLSLTLRSPSILGGS